MSPSTASTPQGRGTNSKWRPTRIDREEEPGNQPPYKRVSPFKANNEDRPILLQTSGESSLGHVSPSSSHSTLDSIPEADDADSVEPTNALPEPMTHNVEPTMTHDTQDDSQELDLKDVFFHQQQEPSPLKQDEAPLQQQQTLMGMSASSGSIAKGLLPMNDSKVYLLLLQPTAKIFELIQVLYDPECTTIGDLIQMIPINATEPALAHQPYVGLCRPHQQVFMDWTLLATPTQEEASKNAGIQPGEVLVAIPKGSTAEHVGQLCQYILSHDRIHRLLPDPTRATLGPDNKHKKPQPQDFQTDDFEESHSSVRRGQPVLEVAKLARKSRKNRRLEDDDCWSECSYTSWSQSFDNSFVRRRRLAARHLQQQQRQQLVRPARIVWGAAAVLLFMTLVYLVDPNGYFRTDATPTQPLGFFGSLELVVIGYALCSLQQLVQSSNERTHKTGW